MESTLSKEQIREILRSFGISEDERATRVYGNVWDICGRFILKQYPNPDELKKSLWLSEFLSERNIPVRQYLKTIDGNYLAYSGGVGYCMMSKIKGSRIDPLN